MRKESVQYYYTCAMSVTIIAKGILNESKPLLDLALYEHCSFVFEAVGIGHSIPSLD